MVLLAAEICEDKKATDTRILELDPVDAGFTDFFLVTSGSNTRQTGAIADEIELRMKHDFGTYAKSVEGRRSGEWILLDYVDFVVHIFTEETREFYDIERLRKSARHLNTAELTLTLEQELRERTEAARKKAPAKKAPAKALGPGSDEAADRDSEREHALQPPAKKAAKKSALKTSAAKKAPAKKAAAQKTPAKKASAKKAATSRMSSPVEDLSLPALPSGGSEPGQLPARASSTKA